MEEKLNEYIEKFNENFPIFLFRGAEEEEIIKTIEKCIKENEPYKADLLEDSNY